jgi:hypothetical protein
MFPPRGNAIDQLKEAPLKVLYSSNEVRKAITQIFSKTAGRRVVITAFVGKGAEAFLPNPEGLELICWPKAGGTNPTALRDLIERGVKVSFADSLHMKVYWSELGAVVTSANLSNNALGSGGLLEFGVLLSADEVNIKKIIAQIGHTPVTETAMAKLERETNLYASGQNIPRVFSKKSSFKDWYSGLPRAAWKFTRTDGYAPAAKSVKERTLREYGIVEPTDSLTCTKNDFKPGEWVFRIAVTTKGIKEYDWMYVDFVEPIAKSDHKVYSKDWPYQAAQVHPLGKYRHPPFELNKSFRKAFSKAVYQYGVDNIRGLSKWNPPKRLIDLIHENWSD